MNHLGFIAGAYGLGTLIPIAYAVAAWQRASTARRRLAAVDATRARA
jgi:hypothetical protein